MLCELGAHRVNVRSRSRVTRRITALTYARLQESFVSESPMAAVLAKYTQRLLATSREVKSPGGRGPGPS